MNDPLTWTPCSFSFQYQCALRMDLPSFLSSKVETLDLWGESISYQCGKNQKLSGAFSLKVACVHRLGLGMR